LTEPHTLEPDRLWDTSCLRYACGVIAGLAKLNEEFQLLAVRLLLLLNRCTGGPAPRPFEEIAGIPGEECKAAHQT
jgi:hypothetical protein